jgi:drug/metabolite transporter (DMT)-like permease
VSNSASALIIAVPAAVGAAAIFGLASAIQQRATKQVPPAGTLNPRLLLELVRQPLWVLGGVTVVVGLALQLLALAFAPLVLVQPLLATGVLFATVFSALLAHRGVDRLIVLGALASVAGLAAFLLFARPTDTTGKLADGAKLLPLTVVLGLIVTACLVAATRFSGAVRVAALAVATGVFHGLTAGLMKIVASEFRSGGLGEVLGHPTLYLLCVVGPMGLLLSQNTYQQATHIAPALAVITIVDPLVGVAIGVSWLGERVNSSPAALAGEAISAMIMIGGIVVLAHRGTQIRHEIWGVPMILDRSS